MGGGISCILRSSCLGSLASKRWWYRQDVLELHARQLIRAVQFKARNADKKAPRNIEPWNSGNTAFCRAINVI